MLSACVRELFCKRISILQPRFRPVQEQIDAYTRLSQEHQIKKTDSCRKMFRSIIGEINLFGLFVPVSLMLFDCFCKDRVVDGTVRSPQLLNLRPGDTGYFVPLMLQKRRPLR